MAQVVFTAKTMYPGFEVTDDLERELAEAYEEGGQEAALGHFYTILDSHGINIEEFEAYLIEVGLYEKVDP